MQSFIDTTILTHTEIFLTEDNIHQNYYISNKHYFSFNNINELLNKLNKYKNGRLTSLNDEAYFLIQSHPSHIISQSQKLTDHLFRLSGLQL